MSQYKCFFTVTKISLKKCNTSYLPDVTVLIYLDGSADDSISMVDTGVAVGAGKLRDGGVNRAVVPASWTTRFGLGGLKIK